MNKTSLLIFLLFTIIAIDCNANEISFSILKYKHSSEEIHCLSIVQRYRALKKHQVALEMCTRFLKENPSFCYVRKEKGEILLQMNKFQEAEKEFEYLLTNHPEYPVGYLSYARLLVANSKDKKVDSILLEWVTSKDINKRKATIQAIKEAITELRERQKKH